LDAVAVGSRKVEANDASLACLDPTLAALQLWDFRDFVRRVNLLEVFDDILNRAVDVVQRSFTVGLDFPFELSNFVAWCGCLETLDLDNWNERSEVSQVSRPWC